MQSLAAYHAAHTSPVSTKPCMLTLCRQLECRGGCCRVKCLTRSAVIVEGDPIACCEARKGKAREALAGDEPFYQ